VAAAFEPDEFLDARLQFGARISISCMVEGGVGEEEMPTSVAPEGFQT
jgi:hypothetical protein